VPAATSGALNRHAGLPARPAQSPDSTAHTASSDDDGTDHVIVLHGKDVPVTIGHTDHKPDDSIVGILLDASSLTPDEIFKQTEKEGQPAPGLEAPYPTADGTKVYYTGAGQDYLREQLQGLVDAEPNADVRAQNLEFSKGVGDADYDVDTGAGTGKISLRFSRGGQVMHADFNGTFSADRKLRAGDIASGDQVAIEATCLDSNGRCHTMMLKVTDGSGPQPRTAIVIARDARASLHILSDGGRSANNPEFDRVLSILNNTILHPERADKVTALHMQTSETINGPSSFYISMDMGMGAGQTQTLDWHGPLIKAANSDKLNMTLRQDRAKATVNGAPAEVSYLLSDAIRSVRTRRDDGRGDLQIELTIRAATQGSNEDTINLTFSRINNPIDTPTSL
jgi:hypothetical protein